nr:MAG TPA: hypothetical protein [Caudoviricetes sp.]
MAVIMHPLTAQKGSPEYTANDYRHAINPLLLPSDGSAFNGLSGIRYGSPSPLVTVSGLTATVKAHCGTISPWDSLGAYTYAITTDTTVQLADSTNNYKIAVTVEDPSQSHGTTPRGKIEVFTAGTPDSNINGLVIAEVNAGVASDVAPMIRNNAILMARDLEQLDTIDAVDGQEAVTIADNVHYVRSNGTWASQQLFDSSDTFTTKGYTNSNNWFEFTFSSRATSFGSTQNVGFAKFGNINCCHILHGGWYMLSAFLNVKYDYTDTPTVWFRRYSENQWTKYIDTHVSFTKNDWKAYTALSIPAVVYNIPDNTVISLGLGDSFVSAVGGSTEFTVTRINRNL